jgi:hypothetical protein
VSRKDLIREYKEARRPHGVYRIHNTVADRSLIGASTDVPSVHNRHRAQLGFGGHPNRALQQDWNALGPSAFAFETLDLLELPEAQDYDPKEDLRVLEQLWRDKLVTSKERSY